MLPDWFREGTHVVMDRPCPEGHTIGYAFRPRYCVECEKHRRKVARLKRRLTPLQKNRSEAAEWGAKNRHIPMHERPCRTHGHDIVRNKHGHCNKCRNTRKQRKDEQKSIELVVVVKLPKPKHVPLLYGAWCA